MANEFDFDADEQAVASTPEDRARAIVACLDLVRADAVDLDIPELDRLLGAARMAVTDYIGRRTQPPAVVVPLDPAASSG